MPICIVSGRGLVSARVVDGKVLDRGVRALRMTRPGPIHLDSASAEMLTGRFNIERTGTTAYLRAESTMLDSRPLLLGKATPCVGRTRELATLEVVFAGCSAECVASPVLVVGAPGAGKSRLGREFIEKIRRVDTPMTILTGRAPSLGAGSPFGMIADAIRKTSAIQEADPIDLRRHKLSARLSAHLEGQALSRATAFLGELIGTTFPDDHDPALRAARESPQLMGDSMCAAWDAWLTAECAAAPVLLVLEDLQWGDAATVKLVDSTLRNFRDRPLMVLALARPEVATQFPGLWSEREVQTIKLGPLSKRAAEQLVTEALGAQATPEAVARIVERADGNPFYLEELVRAVAAGRVDAFPDSVLGTVEARLDAEGSEAKRVLRAASVFGERFSKGGLAALLGGERHADEAGEWLKTLAARELVGPASIAVGSADPQYAFRHAIVREAAYATLTEEDRVLGHRLAAEWLERTGYADAATMAEHFLRGAEPGRAIRWYVRAAEQALEANDLGAAIARARRGAECGAAGVALGELRLIEAEATLWRGDLALAEDCAVEATYLLATGSSSWYRAVRQASLAAGKLGDFARVEAWVTPTAAATPLPGAEARAPLASRAARPTSSSPAAPARPTPSSPCSPTPWPILRARAPGRRRARSSSAACARPTPATSPRASPASRPRSRPSSAPAITATRAPSAQPQRRLRRGSGTTPAPKRRCAWPPAVADRMGLQDVGLTALQNLGHVLAYRMELAEARRVEQRARGFRALGDPRMEGVARMYLAEIAFLSGDFDAAEQDRARRRRPRGRPAAPLRRPRGAGPRADRARPRRGSAERGARDPPDPRVARRHRRGRGHGAPRPRRGPPRQRRSGGVRRGHPPRPRAPRRARGQDQRRRLARPLPRRRARQRAHARAPQPRPPRELTPPARDSAGAACLVLLGNSPTRQLDCTPAFSSHRGGSACLAGEALSGSGPEGAQPRARLAARAPR